MIPIDPKQNDPHQPSYPGIINCSLIALALICILFPVQGSCETGPYKIGPGDILNLSVWKNSDLTRQVTVLPNGIIHLPLAGQIKAAGLSVRELEEKLKKKLTPFVPEPEICIMVQQINSLVVYVTGKVRNPGRFLLYDNLNVLQVLSLAGGMTPFAKEKKISILRKDKGDTQMFLFNYKAVSKGEHLEQNILLKRGDVIVVD